MTRLIGTSSFPPRPVECGHVAECRKIGMVQRHQRKGPGDNNDYDSDYVNSNNNNFDNDDNDDDKTIDN